MTRFLPATSDDGEPLLALVRRYYAEDGLVFEPGKVGPALGRLLAEPALGRAFFILSGDSGERAGYVVFTFGFDHEAGGPLATVTDLFVEPPFRRRGLAGKRSGSSRKPAGASACAGWSCRWKRITPLVRPSTAALASGRIHGCPCSCRWIEGRRDTASGGGRCAFPIG